MKKSVESAVHYSKKGASALLRGVKKGLEPEEARHLPVNRDPKRVAQKITSPTTWFWLRNTAALLLFCSILAFFDSLFGDIAELIFCFFWGLVCVWGILRSHRNMILSRDFQRLRREIQDQTVLPVVDVMSALDKPRDTVLSELSTMIRKDYFPQGRIVENGEFLLLDTAAYRAYKESYVHVVPKKEEATPLDSQDEEEVQDDRAEAIENYGKILQEQKERARSYEIKDKIGAILQLLDSIHHAIQTNPARVDSLNKFVDYYTPTTIKLIERYLQFESSAIITEPIQSTMNDILRSLDTVIDAYKKLLSTLYQDDLLELNAEMNVMETILKQDGLLETDQEGDTFHE